MRVLYPPHPSVKISCHNLDKYEKTNNWIAQRKFNGTNILINISPDKKINLLTRHGHAPKTFHLSKNHVEQILNLNLDDGKEYWFNGELLDSKTKNKEYKAKIVLFDVLQAGEYFIRKPDQIKRLEILKEICKNPKDLEPNKGIALKVGDDIWLAEYWHNDFKKHYEEFLNMDEIEGLILRKKDSFLTDFGSKKYDVPWMLKCRKPHSGGNYNF
jgi:ATP-dependent DNA ligase